MTVSEMIRNSCYPQNELFLDQSKDTNEREGKRKSQLKWVKNG